MNQYFLYVRVWTIVADDYGAVFLVEAVAVVMTPPLDQENHLSRCPLLN